MSRRRPLPAPYDSRPFHVREAVEAGITPRRLRDPQLRTAYVGVRSGRPPRTPEEAALVASLALRAPHAFSHDTAARLLGMPLPRPWTADEPIHVVTPGRGCHVNRPGIVGHRGLEQRAVVRLASGLVCTSATQTWADLAPVLGLDDLVAAGDWLLRPRSVLSPADVRDAVRPGARGARRARRALEEIRPGSASPMETRTRLLAVRGGLPEPELNADVVDPSGWVACVDMLWREWRVVAEYDGRHHVERQATWERDLERDRALRRAGYVVVHLTARDVLGPRPRAVELIREALVDAGWAPTR